MNFGKALLLPLAALYEVGARIRSGLYAVGFLSRRGLPGTVISVGNITVGGTGKTPMTIWLAHSLMANGAAVGILSRGYGGFMRAGGGERAEGGADEAAVMAGHLSRFAESQLAGSGKGGGGGGKFQVSASKDRAGAAVRLAQAGFDTFILDDAFQSLYLHRDLDVVLIDALNPFGGGHLLPAGRLREPKSALRRADIVVITRSKAAPALERAVRRHSAAPIFYATVTLDGVVETRRVDRQLVAGAALAEEARKGKKFFAFCGIGNSGAFFGNLREWGMTVVGQRAYADHHRYSAADRNRMEEEARAAGADALICTEKDLVNLGSPAGAGEPDDRGLPLYCCVISMQVQDGAKFWRAAGEILQRRKREIRA